MTFEQQEKLFSKFTEEQRAIMFKKGNDYAGADRLSNFKVTGAITQLSAEQAALQMIATKVARLGVLLQPGKVANNESIDDSVVDLANYAFLLVCLLRERVIESEGLKEKLANIPVFNPFVPGSTSASTPLTGQSIPLNGSGVGVTTYKDFPTTSSITQVDLEKEIREGRVSYTTEKINEEGN